MIYRLSGSFLFCFLLRVLASSQDIQNFAKHLTVNTLPNGLTVMIYERHEVPIFSYYRMVDVGDVQDPLGSSGLAHMIEHMALKGTVNVGTTNYAAEDRALKKVEIMRADYDRESRKRIGRDDKKLSRLSKMLQEAENRANIYVISNQLREILRSEGAVGVNAETTMDDTSYFFSMPSNRLEVWACLESDRIANPVFREFYRERDVVLEERRMRVDDNPVRRLVEQLQAAAYVAHPYHRPAIGWAAEAGSLTATEAMEFYRKYYTPSNTVIALVGDIYPDNALRIIRKYFGSIPAAPKPDDIRIVEPIQFLTRSVVLRDKAQSIYIEAYHRPDYRDPDDAVYAVIQDVLSNGRTSRLYRSLVRDKRIATVAAAFSGFPGVKYPALFAFYGLPIPGHTPKEIADAIHDEIAILRTSDMEDNELMMVKARARAVLIRGLDNNQVLAGALATVQTRRHNWTDLFLQIERIQKVTKADVRRVANQAFIDSNRTTAEIDTPTLEAKPSLGR
jgi:predicted Zn-dependent peptidase